MSDPKDDQQTKETIIQHQETIIETQNTKIEAADRDALQQTQETIIQTQRHDLPGGNTDRDVGQTRETVMLTQKGESGESRSESGQEPRELRGDEKYEYVKSLGKGGFAWVYLVRNLDLNRLEAMKILNTELAEDEEVTNRFVKEAQISAKFHHQNIITIYEVQRRGRWTMFKAPDEVRKRHREPFVYFTMSFVEGDTSTNLIRKKKRLDQKEAVSIVMDTCAALAYAHGKGVVHRDIKPDNILVDRQGNGIVMDFGIAKAADQTRQTAAGTFMGTARYVSPEQAMGKEIDGRTDIYSLGITLYELVTGRVPFDSDQWMTVLYQHINEAPPPPDKFFSEIDRDLRTIILKMLEKKPENRYQTAQEVYDSLNQTFVRLGGADRGTTPMDAISTRPDLQHRDSHTQATEIVGKTGQPPVRTQVREKAKEEPKSKTPLIIGAGAALVAVLALAFFLTRDKEVPPPVEPKPEQAQNNNAVTPGPMGQVLISAFPTGKLIAVQDENNNKIPFDQDDLPQILSLPEGTYKIVVSYRGENKVEDIYVAAGSNLNAKRLHFDVDETNFLLEDLK